MKAVIFDMDGTLLDTEKIYQKYWNKAAKELGNDITPEQFLLFRSLGHSYAVELAKELTGSASAYDEIRSYRKKLMDPVMEVMNIPLKPYVTEALTLLKNSGITLAVATATKLDLTENYLKRAGLISFFDEIISARSVNKGKPAPDVYLYACEKIGAEPEETFAVEDAPNGVKSAYNAGCKVIMVPDMTEPEDELLKIISYKAGNLLEAAEYVNNYREDIVIQNDKNTEE